MSAAEIIEEIEKLPGEDRRKVEEFLASYRQQALRNMFAHFDSLPRGEQMTEEEILALPREIPARY